MPMAVTLFSRQGIDCTVTSIAHRDLVCLFIHLTGTTQNVVHSCCMFIPHFCFCIEVLKNMLMKGRKKRHDRKKNVLVYVCVWKQKRIKPTYRAIHNPPHRRMSTVRSFQSDAHPVSHRSCTMKKEKMRHWINLQRYFPPSGFAKVAGHVVLAKQRWIEKCEMNNDARQSKRLTWYV